MSEGFNINPNQDQEEALKQEAATELAYLDELRNKDFALSTAKPIEILEKIDHIIQYQEKIKTNPFLKEGLAKATLSFIEENWTGAISDDFKAKNDQERELNKIKLEQMKSVDREFDDLSYFNNFTVLFRYTTKTSTLLKFYFDEISKEDFKKLKLDQETLAKLEIYNLVNSTRNRNNKNISLKDPIGDTLGQRVKALNPILESIFDRLVLEAGYDPEKIAI